MIFIIKSFQIIVFIFIVISTTFRAVCPPAFFRCLSNSETYTKLRTTSFIESTGVACSDSSRTHSITVIGVGSLCVLLESEQATPVDSIKDVVRLTPEEGHRTYRPKRCGNSHKDEDNSPKTLNDKKILKSTVYPTLPISSRRIVGFIAFPRAFVLCKM